MENQRYESTSYVWRNCSPRDYPPDYEHLLLCNGQTINADDYPELVAALGTNVLPNLNGRVLQGAETAGEYKEAGLPNITGESYLGEWGIPAGAFYTQGTLKTAFLNEEAAGRLCFDASRSNAIYGKSTTVQPPAYTVRYYICYG